MCINYSQKIKVIDNKPSTIPIIWILFKLSWYIKIPKIVATTADEIENNIAPLARPEPFLIADSQNIFANIYPIIAHTQSQLYPFNEYSFANISATSSLRTKNDRGISQ